jgi:hypothetical protein
MGKAYAIPTNILRLDTRVLIMGSSYTSFVHFGVRKRVLANPKKELSEILEIFNPLAVVIKEIFMGIRVKLPPTVFRVY